jgi:glycosyltransferase involved in cell wall biosynthesis
MDFVTITDHDTLAGSAAVAHLPGTFLSAEVNAWFPEDGCQIHVVVLDPDERHFPEFLALRRNVYELVEHLRATGTMHFVSHPLYSVNGRLTPDTVEKICLLFDALEARNGARSARSNLLVERVVEGLTPTIVERLAAKHGIEPVGAMPWRRVLVGGSDDHSGLSTASAWTETPCDGTVSGFLAAVRRGDGGPGGEHGGVLRLAHSIYAVGRCNLLDLAGQYGARGVPGLRRALSAAAHVTLDDDDLLPGARQAAHALLRGRDGAVARSTFDRALSEQADALLAPDTSPPDLDRRLHGLGVDLCRASFSLSGARIEDGVRRRRPARLLAGVAGLAATHALTTPYYVAHRHMAAERPLLAQVRHQLVGPDPSGPDGPWSAPALPQGRKVAVFTDTLHEVNGVALTLKRLMHVADLRGIPLEVITSSEAPSGRDGSVVTLQSCGGFRVPRYPELSIRCPSLLDIVDHLEGGGFTDVHVSTPGSIGLLGLMAGRLLGLRVGGTYHTDIPRYARDLGGSRVLEEVAWRWVIWFYGRLDEVLVPSAATGRELTARGLPGGLISPLPRWVDTDLFSPRHRDTSIWASTPVEGRMKLLYAGRVSKEKNLELLAATFRSLVDRGARVGLVVAGDGPYREAMESSLAGYPALFLGLQDQQRLAVTYASSDVFVFPSATDTFGNVVLEAQSSGLPVIVSDRGGPLELMVNGVTGLRVPSTDLRALAQAVRFFLDDPYAMALMGMAARAHCEAGAMAPEDQFSTLLGPIRAPERRRVV